MPQPPKYSAYSLRPNCVMCLSLKIIINSLSLYFCLFYIVVTVIKPFKIKLNNHFLFTELHLTSVLRKTSYTHYMLRALKILIKQFILIILFSYEMRSTFGNLRPSLQLYFPLWILYEFISS
jgi:hypothetical protein